MSGPFFFPYTVRPAHRQTQSGTGSVGFPSRDTQRGANFSGPQGLPGSKGPKGDRGPAGKDGRDGRNAPILKTKDWEIDAANFAVREVLSDGRRMAVLDLRPLFEEYQRQTS